MRIIFDHAELVAENTYSFWFQPERPVRYTAGQFTELYLAKEHRRFTLSSSPSEPLLTITTRIGPWSSSFKHALVKLQPGDQLRADEPLGDFVLPKDPTIPLIFVASGIGVTPFRSMVKWLADTNEQRNIQFLYFVKHKRQALFLELFKSAGYAPKVLIGTNQLNAQFIIQQTQPSASALVFLSGSEHLVETLRHDLQSFLPAQQIVTDAFLGYSTPL